MTAAVLDAAERWLHIRMGDGSQWFHEQAVGIDAIICGLSLDAVRDAAARLCHVRGDLWALRRKGKAAPPLPAPPQQRLANAANLRKAAQTANSVAKAEAFLRKFLGPRERLANEVKRAAAAAGLRAAHLREARRRCGVVVEQHGPRPATWRLKGGE